VPPEFRAEELQAELQIKDVSMSQDENSGKPFIPSAVIGAEIPRIDGPLKTTGAALYAADYHFPNLLHAVPVTSTIASGTLRTLDCSVAEKMPGVTLVLHHENLYRATYPSSEAESKPAPLFRIPYSSQGGDTGRTSEARPPLSDNRISYWGQYIALVLAETCEQAQAAAVTIKVEYAAESVNVSTALNDSATESLPLHTESKRGDVEQAFAGAPVKIDLTYTTPAATHNPIEMHATVAVWDNPNFVLYETSQGVVNHQHVMAATLGVPRENVHVITRFLGAGFGGKLFPWPHSALAAAAARYTGRPVKLSVNRAQMFASVGHRPFTQQRLKLAATADGKLVSIHHDYRNPTSIGDDIKENCGEATPSLYSTPNLLVTSALVRRNIGTPAPMRGPGAVPGLYALESAIDELCVSLKMDPVQFRILNDTQTDESQNLPFSSRHFKECLELGAEKFGWSKRNPIVSSMRKVLPKTLHKRQEQSEIILGWGVAGAASYAPRLNCHASVSLLNDGTARVSCGTQDVGTGTYTILAQIVADRTGIPVDRIRVVLGDSSLLPGPASSGSVVTATVIPAVAEATDNAIQTAQTIATSTADSPFFGKPADSLAFTEGKIHAKTLAPDTGLPYQRFLKMADVQGAPGEGISFAPNPNDPSKSKGFSTHSFGAQFVEVEWDPGIAHLRVSRIVSVLDGGRIINLKTATSQATCAAVMGVGMALLEETTYSPKTGQPINNNLGDYLLATNPDTPEIEIHFLDHISPHPDPQMGQYGARGIGEIGLAGVAPAIANAIYHATGVRLRHLPIKVEDLLPSIVS
jgi:xanthine dehydrogenase YagR molybdenum-binding subunit